MTKSLHRPSNWLIALLLVFSILGSQAAADDHLSEKVYLPIIFSPPCLPSSEAVQLADLLEQDPEQARPSLTCNPILSEVAHARAADMAVRGYFDHVNPDGYGPNYLVEQAGYTLPSFYNTEPDANNIKSIAGGYATAESTWQQWASSSHHRMHLLGLTPFYEEQVEYGIGYAYDPDSPLGHYWVIITARPGP